VARQVESPETISMSSTNNESPTEHAACLTVELQAEEQATMAVIRKKRETVRKVLEEVQLKAREEEEVKAQARWEAEEKLLEEAAERARAEAEASRWAQREQDDAEFWGKSGNEKPNSDTELPAALSANAHPEDDGDYQPEGVMDVDEGASPKKGKAKAKAVELEERVGAARCGACAGCGFRCWVDPARVKKWKETVARGVTHGRTPVGVACKECLTRKQRCFLPELSKERAVMKPSLKRGRGEEEQAREDGPWASGSGTRAGGAVKEGDEAPKKKKQRVEVVIPPRPKKDAPRAVQKEELEPDYLLALVNINNSVASLARAITASNIHLTTIARYVKVMVGMGSDLELLSGDEEVSHGLKKVALNTWLDNDWYLKPK